MVLGWIIIIMEYGWKSTPPPPHHPTPTHTFWALALKNLMPRIFLSVWISYVAASFTRAFWMLDGSRLHRSDSFHLFDPNTLRLLSYMPQICAEHRFVSWNYLRGEISGVADSTVCDNYFSTKDQQKKTQKVTVLLSLGSIWPCSMLNDSKYMT